MSAATLATNNPKPAKLDVTAVRDDLARAYNPVGALELMLITQMSQTWVRLQTAYDVDRRYRDGRDMLEVITSKPAEFKAVQSYVRDCERAWNHAKENLEKEQRKRKRESQTETITARPVQSRPVPPPVTDQPKLTVPPVPPVAASAARRE